MCAQTAILSQCCDILRTAKLSLRTFLLKVARLSNNYELCMSVDCEVCLMAVVGVACVYPTQVGDRTFLQVFLGICIRNMYILQFDPVLLWKSRFI